MIRRATSARAACCLLFCGLAAWTAHGAERAFEVAAKPVLEDMYPSRTTAFPGGVTGHADVVYSVLPGYRPLVVDIYTPPASRGPQPLVLFIHGGGWVGGHTRHSGALVDFPGVLARLASEGFVVASLEYRLAAEAPFPAQLQDARAALRFLKANAGRYGIDAARVGVWGGSAGGHLAALAALSCGNTGIDPAPAPPASECVQAAAIWYGVFDFAPILARDAARANGGPNALLRCAAAACPRETVAAASPVTFIDAKDPPFLLIHGEQDATVPVEQSQLAEKALRAAGVKVDALYIPGVDHSFIGATPAATKQATVKATNATFDFLVRTLKDKQP